MTKDLFIKYLQGNCSEEEFEQLLKWIKEGSLTDSGKGMVQEVWNEFEPEAGPAELTKYNRLLDQIHHQINISQNSTRVIVSKDPVRHRILSIVTRVAAILLLPVLTLLVYTNLSERSRYANNQSDLEVMAPAGSRMTIELGDGTKVWLNHGSKLKYPYRFSGKSRKVFLTGEAYFMVAHNSEIPFIVGTERLDVKATGTEFNVSAYPDDNVVETTLVEGKVILYKNNSSRAIKALSPGECLKFDAQKNISELESGSIEKYIAWKDGLLVFKNDPMENIAKKVARWYNVDVEITSEKAKEYTCTATFTEETLSQVLELLTLPTPVHFKLTPREKEPDGSFTKQKVLIGLKANQN
jgi:ferric-dicitrate binding protein FerR (iron transport regulator)